MTHEPTFRVKKDGTKIFEPDTHLKDMLGADINQLISEKNIEAAQNFIENESENFPKEMRSVMQKLDHAFTQFSQQNFTADQDKHDSPDFEDMKTRILSIKSNAGIYGFDLGSEIAHLLFEYCDTHPCIDPLGKKIIAIHIQALKILFHQEIKGHGGEMGEILLKELHDLIAQDTSKITIESGH